MKKIFTALTLASAFAVMLVAAGCGSSTPTSPTTAGATVTETFNGSLAQNGSNIHTFNVSAAGEVDATLTTVGPLNTLALGFVLGSFDGTNCNAAYENDNSRQGQVLSGSTTTTGTFCVRVFDVGNIASGNTVTYTVTVAHP